MTGMRRLSWLVRSVLLVAALVLAGLSAFIVAPAPVEWLIPVGVGAPEMSAWLLLGLAVIGLVAAPRARASGLALATLIVAGLGLAAAAGPLVRLEATITTFDTAMMNGLGADDMQRAPQAVRERWQPSPFRVAALLARTPAGPDPLMLTVPGSGGALELALYRAVGAVDSLAPVVVQIYPGGWRNGSVRDGDRLARTLAAQGYLVCNIDYRHAPQHQWPAQRDDVRASLAWVTAHAAQYGGDPTRLALLGRSAGAQLAMTAAYGAPIGAVRAVVAYYGPVDLAEGWRQPPRPDPLGVRAVVEGFIGGTPQQRPDAYRDASPITYVRAGAPPTLLVYGARDHIVEARFGRLLDRRLRSVGATSIYLELPFAEHAFDVPPGGRGQQIATYYTERFLAWALYR
jgi:acetyl esterase/lipase